MERDFFVLKARSIDFQERGGMIDRPHWLPVEKLAGIP